MGDWKSSYATEVLSCAQEAHDVEACNAVKRKSETGRWRIEKTRDSRIRTWLIVLMTGATMLLMKESS